MGGPDSRACATGNGGAGRGAREALGHLDPTRRAGLGAHPSGRPWIRSGPSTGGSTTTGHTASCSTDLDVRPSRVPPRSSAGLRPRTRSRDRAASARSAAPARSCTACTLRSGPGPHTSTARSSSSVDVAPSSTPTVTGRSSSGRGDHTGGTQAIGGSAHVVGSTSSGSVRARKRCSSSHRRAGHQVSLGRDALHPGENPREDLPVIGDHPHGTAMAPGLVDGELQGGADLVVERGQDDRCGGLHDSLLRP